MTDTPQPPFRAVEFRQTPWQLPEHLRLSYSTDFDPENGIVTHTRDLFGEVTHQFFNAAAPSMDEKVREALIHYGWTPPTESDVKSDS